MFHLSSLRPYVESIPRKQRPHAGITLSQCEIAMVCLSFNVCFWKNSALKTLNTLRAPPRKHYMFH